MGSLASVCNLVKKTDCNTKLIKIGKKPIDHDNNKYIATPEFNNLNASVLNPR